MQIAWNLRNTEQNTFKTHLLANDFLKKNLAYDKKLDTSQNKGHSSRSLTVPGLLDGLLTFFVSFEGSAPAAAAAAANLASALALATAADVSWSRAITDFTRSSMSAIFWISFSFSTCFD